MPETAAEEDAGEGEGAHVAAKKWSKSRPYLGAITALEGLCTISSKDDKNTCEAYVHMLHVVCAVTCSVLTLTVCSGAS